jgi:hypothetical protein
MDASHWHGLGADSMGSKGNPEFTREEGFPQGLMTLKEGSAGRDGLTFKDGTIEYDFKAIGEGAPGKRFWRLREWRGVLLPHRSGLPRIG